MLSSSRSIRRHIILEGLSTFASKTDLWTNPPPFFLAARIVWYHVWWAWMHPINTFPEHDSQISNLPFPALSDTNHLFIYWSSYTVRMSPRVLFLMVKTRLYVMFCSQYICSEFLCLSIWNGHKRHRNWRSENIAETSAYQFFRTPCLLYYRHFTAHSPSVWWSQCSFGITHP